MIFLFIFLPSAFASPKNALPDKQDNKRVVVAEKTLTREYDPIVITGDLLPMIGGLEIKKFRLFAHDGLHFKVIPFQIDERNPDGHFVFTSGKSAGKDEDNGLFDYNDELVFMARDAGCRMTGEAWKKMSNKGIEILIADPIDISKKAWVYLIYFNENPPPFSNVDYVSFTKGKGIETIQSDYYKIQYKEGATFYSYLSYPETNGGNGEDFMDRIKVRIKVKALFNILRISKSEEDMHDEVLGWKDGPVRALRYAESYFTILFDIADPSMKSTTEFYSYLAHQPVMLDIPFNMKWFFSSFSISDFSLVFYGDLPGLEGGKAYSNKNLKGFQFTGNHRNSSLSKKVDTDNLVWGITQKDGVGAWFPCLIMPELLYGISKLYLLDDNTLADPPEDVPGVIGAGMKIGMEDVSKDVWSVLQKGSYQLALDTYFPRADMEMDEVDDWLNIRGFPLVIDITGEHGPAIAASGDALGAKGKSVKKKKRKKKKSKKKSFSGVVTDVRGREFELDNIHAYFGSAEVTPRTYLAAKTGSGKSANYYLLEFEDINRIDHYIEDIDPFTGMKNPMFQKLTISNGDTRDFLGCKPCGFSGELEDGRRIFFWNTQVKSVQFEKE